MSDACATCAYMKSSFADDKSLVMICRRYPPTSHVQMLTAPQGIVRSEATSFPRVRPEDWCGEFQLTQDSL